MRPGDRPAAIDGMLGRGAEPSSRALLIAYPQPRRTRSSEPKLRRIGSRRGSTISDWTAAMGSFTDALSHRIRARRGARAIRHPKGAGVVMWCSSCRAELLRAAPGKAPTMKAQRNAYDAHAKVCSLRHLPREATRQAIERWAHRMIRRAWWHRRRWIVVGAVLASVGGAVLAWWRW